MTQAAEELALTARFQRQVRQLLRAGGLAAGWPQAGLSVIAVIAFFAGASLIFLKDNYPGALAPDLAIASVNAESKPQLEADWNYLFDSLPTAAWPWYSVIEPLADLLWPDLRGQTVIEAPSQSFLSTMLDFFWALVVWSLFGTAICRAVAVMIAKDRTESFREAVQFAWPRWPLALGAPATPFAGIMAIGIALIVVAWLGRFPWLGTIALSLASPLLFLAGLAMEFLALVIILGWPLMVAAMGVEDCDGFGTLSRSYSFLAARPLMAAVNVAISAIVGGVLVAIAGGLLTFGLLAEANFLEVSIGTAERWATVMQWSHFFAQGLLLSFAASLFWTLVTLNYLLLREEVDGKPFDDIAPGVAEMSAPRDLPVVGIPATDYRPVETDGQPVASQDAQG